VKSHSNICTLLGRTMCHAGTKSARSYIAPLPEPQWGLTLIEPLRPYYLGSGRRSRSDWKKQFIPSTSRTLATRRRRTMNKLTGRSGCSFHQCPVSANSIASQLVKNGARKTRDRKYTRLVNKELSDLWKIATPEGTVSLNPLGRRSLLLPSDPSGDP